MSRAENLTKYTCDICGKNEYAKKNDAAPMQEYRLPMKYYTETGKFSGMTNQRVDLCSDCSRELERTLSEHYDMYMVAYGDVVMKRKEQT
jgi:hypothetical protein